MKVRFAVSPGGARYAPVELAAFARTAESLGFDTIWLSDVPLAGIGDPLVSLAHIAAVTTKLKLGLNLVPIGRNPMLMARQLAQLDQLSAGRLLVTLVPGLGSPDERRALGMATGDRGLRIEEMTGLLRRFWAGERVDHHSPAFDFPGVVVEPRPLQDPLEIWMGGTGPKALARVAHFADGWLTANVTPAEATAGRDTILAAAAKAGRDVDVEHFGISVPYARTELSGPSLAAAVARRPDGDVTDIVPVGADALEGLIRRHIDGGLSKFVLRPIDAGAGRSADDLAWLADVVLPLQT